MALLRELSLETLLSRVAGVLIFVALQGFFLALFARLMGDRRPQNEGRLTPNPFAQLSVWGAVIGALFALTWPRPMRMRASANRFGLAGVIVAVVLSLVAVALFIPIADWLRSVALMLPRTGGYAVILILQQFQLLAAGSILLNLLPIPGLAMGSIWTALWPEREKRLLRHEPLGVGLVIIALVVGIVPNLASYTLPFLSRL